MNADGKDLYDEVTQKIVSDLEKGVRPWQQPWASGKSERGVSLPLRVNGLRYRGINVVLLWSEAILKGFTSPVWITYDQAKLQGGHVRRGEHGTMIVFASSHDVTETNDAGEEKQRKIPILKRYTVFNVAQVDGLPADSCPQSPEPRPKLERIDGAEAFIRAAGPIVQQGGDKAFYSQSQDIIQMPSLGNFNDPETFYATLLHETTHWAGAANRLNRDFGKVFGDEDYAREELVAEIGAAFLCAELKITPKIREDHAAYISQWLKILKEDHRAIFRAAALAQRAPDYLKELQQQTPAPAVTPPTPTENPAVPEAPEAPTLPESKKRRARSPNKRSKSKVPAPE